MKTSISFTNITTAMQSAGIEIGRIYTVSKVIWKNGVISEVHTHQHRFLTHAAPHGISKLISLVGVDWALEFGA